VTDVESRDRGRRSTAELAGTLDGLIQRLLAHPDSSVSADVQALLTGLDELHRGGLTRLVAEIESIAGEAFLNRLGQDPQIQLLLMSYGLVSVSRAIQADEALDAVRPHLASHGVAIGVREVVGGVVYIDLETQPGAVVNERALRADLETALRAGFLGFQEVQIGERPQTPPASGLVQLKGPRGPRWGAFATVATVTDLAESGLLSAGPSGEADSVLLLDVNGEVHAYENRCAGSPLPLHFSRLERGTLICSWHGCRYDAATGHRLDHPSQPSLVPVPVRVVEGEVLVAQPEDGS
jgi:toluene monooxygenase system ferredoxin subunit